MTNNVIERKGSTLGERIRIARQEQRISIAKIARALDVDARTVARWQSDDATPSIVRLGELARLLQKPPSYFLDEVAA